MANRRLFSTLIEAAGGAPPPASPPSLFESSSEGALSELYLGNGVNRLSLVEGDRQLLWTSRFAPAEERYHDAMLALAGGKPETPLAEAPEELTVRLEREFEAAPPLMGAPGTRPRIETFEWTTGGAARRVDRADDFARRLQDRWQAENGPDRAAALAERGEPDIGPEEMERLRTLGYVVTSRKPAPDGD